MSNRFTRETFRAFICFQKHVRRRKPAIVKRIHYSLVRNPKLNVLNNILNIVVHNSHTPFYLFVQSIYAIVGLCSI